MQHRDPAAVPPDFDVVPVDKFLRGADRVVVVMGNDVAEGIEVSVVSDDVGAVVRHGRFLRRRELYRARIHRKPGADR